MKKTAISFFTAFAFLFGVYSLASAGLQKDTPYNPAPAKEYHAMKKYFPPITENELKKSISVSQNPELIKLINDILIYLKYKKIIQNKKPLPPIFLLYYEDNRGMPFTGGFYSSSDNFIALNANFFYTSAIKPNNLPKNIRAALDFVSYAVILGHEIKHYEDDMKNAETLCGEGSALSEYNAYKRSEKILEYFMKMSKGEADEVIDIPGFYNSMQFYEDFFLNMRKYYIKLADAAKIFLNNEQKIINTLAIDKNKFDCLTFFPHVVFNAKDEGHIIEASSYLCDIPYSLIFEINLISQTLEIVNSPQEIKQFKKEAQKIKIINGKIYRETKM